MPGGAGDPERDRAWMGRALDAAREAAARDEVPVGAVIVAPDGWSAADHNRTRELSDPTAHAEMLVIRRAGRRQGDFRLERHTLYVTLEPCAMCAGAVVNARVPRLVYGAADPKSGMCGSLGDVVRDRRLNHRAEVVAGVRGEEASELLTGFFRERR